MGKKLNTAQQKAVCHETGPMLVLAGPGSGKTTVLLCRISRLLERGLAKPQEILALTFSKAAAEEMKSRFENLNGASGVSFGTFHSIFFRILRSRYGWNVEQIFQEEERRNILRNSIEAEKWDIPDLEEYISQFFSQLSLMNSELEQPNRFTPVGMPVEEFRKLYRAYEGYKERHEKLDFDDMLTQCYQLLREDAAVREYWQRKYKFILVDEFQDVNQAQFACLQILAEKHQNLFVVGDDDQSIYGFRGSAPQIMLDFNKYYSDAVRIDMCINYRSTGNIVFASRAVAEENEHRYYKDITTYNSQGDTVSVYEFNSLNDEKAFLVSEIRRLIDTGIAADDIAVLSRTNVIGNMYMSRLESDGIPCCDYSVVQDIYEHWISKDILTYIRIALGSRERIDFLRIINKPLRYISRSYITQPADINALKRGYEGNEQMSEQVEKLASDINMIRNMSPFAAVNYIRKGIGYDEYIRNYIYEHKADKEELYNVLDELAHRASRYMSLSQWLDGITEYLKQCDTQRRNNTVEGVHMLTMHGSKGLEYKIVMVMDVCEGIIPYNKAVLDEQIEEERRLFYVAMTRAKEKLYLLYPKQRYNKDTTRSRFIEELLTARYPLLRTDLHTP